MARLFIKRSGSDSPAPTVDDDKEISAPSSIIEDEEDESLKELEAKIEARPYYIQGDRSAKALRKFVTPEETGKIKEEIESEGFSLMDLLEKADRPRRMIQSAIVKSKDIAQKKPIGEGYNFSDNDIEKITSEMGKIFSGDKYGLQDTKDFIKKVFDFDTAEMATDINKWEEAVKNNLIPQAVQDAKKQNDEYQEMKSLREDLIDKFEDLPVASDEFKKVSKKLDALNKKMAPYETVESSIKRNLGRAISSGTVINPLNIYSMIGSDQTFKAGDTAKFALELATDVVTDPLTYVPAGAFVSVGKAPFKATGKAAALLAKSPIGIKAFKYLDESKIAPVIKYVGSKIDDIDRQISKRFNITRFFSKLKGVDGKSIDASEDFKQFAEELSRGAGPELKRATQDFVQTMNVEESEMLGKALAEASDDVRKAFGEFRSEKLKSDLASTLIDEEGLVEGGVDVTKKLGFIDDLVEKVSRRQSKDVDGIAYRTTNKQRRAKKVNGMVDQYISAERAAARKKASLLFTADEKLGGETIKKLRAERRDLLNSLKNKDKAYSDIVKGYSNNLQGEVMDLRDSLKKMTKIIIGEDFDASKIENVFENENLNQFFQASEKSLIGLGKKTNDALLKIRKVTEGPIKNPQKLALLKRAEKRLARLESNLNEVNRLTKEIKFAGKENSKDALKMFNKEIKSLYKQINSDVSLLDRVNRADVKSAFKKYKGNLKEIENVNKEYFLDIRKKLEKNYIDEKDLQVRLKGSSMMRQNAYKNIDRVLGKKKDGLIKLINIADSNKRIASDLYEFKKLEDKVFKESIQKLPDNLRPIAEKARALFDDMQRKGLESGTLDSAEAFYYLPRRLKKDVQELVAEAAKPGFDPSFKPKPGKFRSQFQKKRKTVGEEDFKQAAYKRYLEATKGLPADQIKSIDEVVNYDAADIIMETISDFQMKSTKVKFEKRLAQKLGIESLEKLPANMKDLKDVMDYLYDQRLFKTSNQFVKDAASIWQKYEGYSRYVLTGANPAFYVRNAIGYPFFAARSAGVKQGFNPANAIDAMSVMAAKENQKIAGYTAKEINEAMAEKGVFNSYIKNVLNVKEKDLLLSLNRKGAKANPKDYIIAVAQKMQSVDDYGRSMVTVANLKKGMPLNEAIEKAHKTMFDYNMMNSPVDKALQGMLGFYSFTRRNLPASIKEVVERPKNLAVYNQIVEKLAGGRPLSQEEADLMAPWEKAALVFTKQTAEGLRQMYMSNGTVPLSEAISFVNDMTTGTFDQQSGKILSRASPGVNALVKFFTGKDPYFNNQEIGQLVPPAITKSINDKVLMKLGFVKHANKYGGFYWTGEPFKVRAIASLPLKPLLDAGKLASDKDLLDYLTGAKKIDLTAEEKQKRQYGKDSQIKKRVIEKAINRGAGEFKGYYKKGMPVQTKKKAKKRGVDE